MVARMVWPAMVVLLILAVAGPCLTFYLLIKDYWAEVSSLRRDLLFCQLGTTDLPLTFDLDFPPTSAFPPSLPQAPQPLVATTTVAPTPPSNTAGSTAAAAAATSSAGSASSTTADTTIPPSDTEETVVSPKSAVPGTTTSKTLPSSSTTSTTTTTTPSTPQSSSQAPSTTTTTTATSDSSSNPPDSPKVPLLPLNSPPPSPTRFTDQGQLRGVSRPPNRPTRVKNPQRASGYLGESIARGRGWAPTRPPRSLDRVMSDESSKAADTVAADQEYVALLERQLRDLRARVKACRSCLTPPQRTMATCGGGTAWREHRRRERQLRIRQRAQRRERRRRIKELQANNTTTATPSTTTAEADPVNNPLQADVTSWFSESDMKSDNHRARQNHRMSTDFRRGFNQKISRMDEALMQFTDTQAAFCKELRDNLGGRLEKRGKELGALSNQIAALVRTSTTQINELEKVASNQLYSSQANIEKSLAITQAIRDSQLRAIQSYHKQTFLPAAAAIATILSDQASAATSMGVELITKVEMLQDIYLNYATQQADNLQKVTEDVDMFASKHTNLVMRSRDHANHLHINTETFIRELQTRMNNVVKELVLIRLQSQNFVTLNNNTHNDIFTSLNKTEVAVDNLSQGLKERLQNAKDREQDFRSTFKLETNQISDRLESGISQALVFNHASMSQIEDVELDTRVYVGSSVAAWNELYLNQESELRQEADVLTNSLRSHTHHTQNVLADLRSAAETHEQVLEEQRMDFQRFVRKRQDALDNQCSAITDWAMLMSSELRRRDEDLHRFLSEDLQYTTVTVHEDTDGYLVSRLPDGSLVYQSSPAHAAHPPPNVTYQLEETAYNTGPALSTSHSSPQKPQLEKTLVTSVNSTLSSFRKSINLSQNNTSNSKNDNETTNETEPPEEAWKLTEKYDILEEQNNRINDVDGEEREKIGFSHHSKRTRSEGSSLQKVNATTNNDVLNIGTSTEKRSDEIMHVDSVSTENLNQTNVNIEATRKPPLQNITGERNESTKTDTEKRQNDGTYEPNGGMGCGRMTLHFTRDGDPIPLHGEGTTNYDIFNDDDKGTKKLRTILREAQRTIEKFQMDFQIDDSFRKNKPPLRLWERLKNEEDLEDEQDDSDEVLKIGNSSSIDPPQQLLGSRETLEENNGQASSSDDGELNIPEHRVRHQHHKSLRRKQDGFLHPNLREPKGLGSSTHASSTQPSTSFPSSSSNFQEMVRTIESSETAEVSTMPTSKITHRIKGRHETKVNNSTSSNVNTNENTGRKSGKPAVRYKKKNHRLENETTTVRSTQDIDIDKGS